MHDTYIWSRHREQALFIIAQAITSRAGETLAAPLRAGEEENIKRKEKATAVDTGCGCYAVIGSAHTAATLSIWHPSSVQGGPFFNHVIFEATLDAALPR